MVNVLFDQGSFHDDPDELDEEGLEDDEKVLEEDDEDLEDDEEGFEDDEEGLLLKGGRPFKKATGPHGVKQPEDHGAEPGNARKSHRHDAKSRYWRKHRDDVQW